MDVRTTDYHTAGEPFRIVTGGVEPLEGATVLDKCRYAAESRDRIRELYGGKGITSDKEVTAYCRIGERSAHTWFVLSELLGFERVRNYDGSWTEWGNLVDVPIEKGS